MTHSNTLNILWEGRLPLERIRWGNITFNKVNVPGISQLDINHNWKRHLIANPNDYDGTLLFLESFNQRYKSLILNIRTIAFSTIIYLEKIQMKIPIGIGMLGVQYLIFSPCKQYILVGERALYQEYYPGRLTLPGGMLELKDVYLSPHNALLRELREEIPLLMNININLIAIIGGWNKVSVTFLIQSKIKKKLDFNPSDIIPGEENEWKGNLKWVTLKKLKNLPNNQILDGLIYFKSKIQNNSIRI